MNTGSVKSDALKDDDWGYEPKKAGMAIEAKMGMCIVVILLSAFGFLVYRKFDARQRDLLQANLQAAEQSLPGSTEREFVGEYSEFQKSDRFADTGFAADRGVTADATQQQAVSGIDLQDLEATPSFGSTFALQDESTSRPMAPRQSTLPAEIAAADQNNPFTDGPFDDSPFDGPAFGDLDEPDNTVASGPMSSDGSATLAFAAEASATKPAGQMGSPLDDYLAQGTAKEAAQQKPSANDDSTGSAFAAFGDPAETIAVKQIDKSPSANKTQTTESAPSFDSFPAGFEPEFDSSPAEMPDDTSWVKTDSEISSGQFEPLPEESLDGSADPVSTQEPSSSALASKQTEKATRSFEGFDAFAGESAGLDVAGDSTKSNDVEWSTMGSFEKSAAEKRVANEESVATNSDSGTISGPPGFADFAANDDAPFSGTELSATELSRTETSSDRGEGFAGAITEPLDPLPNSSGASSSESSGRLAASSRPSLSPFSGDDDRVGSIADAEQRRRPSIDPTAVIDPSTAVANHEELSGLDGSMQIAQMDLPPSDQGWGMPNTRFPSGSKETSLVSRANPKSWSAEPEVASDLTVDDGLVNSLNADVQLPPAMPSASFTSTENLRKPRLPNFQQAPVVNNGADFGNSTRLNVKSSSTSNAGKIQQVSATVNPDGIYTVKPDDTYWTISKHAYGTARFFSSLALYNKNRIKDPRKLREGMKVVIPDPTVLIQRYPELLQDYIPKKTMPSGYFLKPDGMPAYRIGERETLSEISQKHLGRASRWIQLYRMNQHVLKNPNRLKPGTVIDLPDDATNVHMVP